MVMQENADFATQARALGQKYLGYRPEGHIDEIFKDTSIHVEKGGHPVLVSNFLNAQCKFP
jgi:saccharopepsin